MNERNKIILDCIIRLCPVSSDKLAKNLDYSIRQINYSIRQINDELKHHNVSTIDKTNGMYYIKSDTSQWFINNYTVLDKGYVYSKLERVYIIIIKIVFRTDSVSLDQLTIDLAVSKNTILTDIKTCNEILQQESKKMRIDNIKNVGYRLHGNEWYKRIICIKAVQYLLNSCGEEQIKIIMNISQDRYENLKAKVQNIENLLTVQFTDNQFTILIYNLEILENRIKRRKFVNKNLVIKPEELADTQEYKAAMATLSMYENVPQSEILYMTLQILTSTTIKKDILNTKELNKLCISLKEFIELFEQNALIEIQDKKGLLERLVGHFKPAYYRIKYNLTTSYGVLDKVSKGFEPLNDLVRQSIMPVEKYLKTTISDNELSYISLFMGGALMERDRTRILERRTIIRALVICPSGISMSNLMKDSLTSVFTEFYFYPATSLRDFENFKHPYDIVFSSVQVKSNKPVFIINEIMDEEEKYYLKKKVMNTLYGSDMSMVDIDKALQIIKRNTTGTVDEIRLKEELFSLLNQPIIEKEKADKKPNFSEKRLLVELLEDSGIVIVDRVSSWMDALTISSQLLIDSNKITRQYQKKLQEVFAYPEIHIVLNQKIAIPHLEAQYGVKGLGMSMLLIKEECIDEQLKCKVPQIVVTIAVKEGLEHLHALQQIMKISRDQDILQELYNCKNVQEVKQVLATINRGDKGD